MQYEGEVLFQGVSDKVVIRLLKDEIEDSTIETYTCSQVRAVADPAKANSPAKSKGFGTASLQHTKVTTFICLANFVKSQCHACKKTVYPMEFVGAADKVCAARALSTWFSYSQAFHKACFKCDTCGTRYVFFWADD